MTERERETDKGKTETESIDDILIQLLLLHINKFTRESNSIACNELYHIGKYYHDMYANLTSESC